MRPPRSTTHVSSRASILGNYVSFCNCLVQFQRTKTSSSALSTRNFVYASHYLPKEILTLCYVGTNLDPLREGRGNPGKGERAGGGLTVAIPQNN